MPKQSTPADVLGNPGLPVYRAVTGAVAELGPHTTRVTTSQIAFRRRVGFAYLWRPGRYVRSDIPAVLSLALPHHDHSPRWKQVAHPSPQVWMHHLEITDMREIDDQVRGWLACAYTRAA